MGFLRDSVVFPRIHPPGSNALSPFSDPESPIFRLIFPFISRISRAGGGHNTGMRWHRWIGAVGYPCLELCWRGRTHPAMALAGALGMEIIARCRGRKGGRLRRAARAAAGITGMELAMGLLWNRRHQIWDYRALPGHFLGQICPQYFALWLLLSAALMGPSRPRT